MRSPALAHVEQRVAFVQPGPVTGFAADRVLGPKAGARVPGAALAAVRRWRPDVVHGWLLQGNLLAAAAKALDPSLVLIASERNVGHALTRPKRVLERLVAALEDVSTANSSAVRDAAVQRLARRAARMRVLHPGVAAPQPPERARRCTAVIVGRLHPVKDHATVLDAWRRVADRRPDAVLHIVGDGPERPALEQRARGLGLDANVVFLGDTDPAPSLYGAELYVQSSRAEGFSRALIEALACGLPVVTTRVGGVDELPGGTVSAVPVGDPGALAAAVLALLDDPQALTGAAAAARDAAAAFTPEASHGRYAQLYAEAGALSAERRAPRPRAP
jgi:hypothetical protein